VTAVYWSLYRLGRRFRPARVRRHGWRWYLQRAHGTAMGMWEHGGEVFPHEQQRVAGQAWSKVGNGQGTAQWGLMVGSIFESLLRDLLLEGWAKEAAELQQVMERRVHRWLSMPFPYGSEFAWDNTGHEEIATWLLAYGHDAQAAQTADAVSAYTSLSPHWAYCGSARRWWDFAINGDARPKYNGNERVLHHYAGALNSVVLFDRALVAREDVWLWRPASCSQLHVFTAGGVNRTSGSGALPLAPPVAR